MKLSLMIADDEYFIRQRLKKVIPWEELDLVFAGEAENGKEVLDRIAATPVDILLLDIKMPKIDGIDVAKHIYENCPMTKVIILSGYSDFSYAKSLMRYGAMDYLLKPIDPESLTSTLSECTQRILNAKEQYRQLQKYHHSEKCSNISGVLNGHMDIKQLLSQYPKMCEKKYSLYIGVFINDESLISINKLMALLHQAQIECEYFKELDYCYMIQVFIENKETITQIKTLLGHFLNDSQYYCLLTISEVFRLHDSWIEYYTLALHLLNQRFFHPESCILTEYKEAPFENAQSALSKIRRNILFYLNGQDTRGFQDYVEALFEQIKRKKNVDFMYLVVTEILLTCTIHFKIQTVSTHGIRQFVYMVIDEEYMLENLKDTVISYGLNCVDLTKAAPSDLAISKKIIAYIAEHYKEADMSVARLADIFSMNISYMGSLFKKVNNQSISQYIMTLRMETSQRLLETNQYKICEIAEMVGYTDAFYYSKRFKKFFGYSPKEYALRSFTD